MPLNIIKSRRGRDLLVHKGFTFRIEGNFLRRKYWKCTEYTSKKCSARCITLDDVITKDTNHNHVPNPAIIEARKLITTMKKKANETQESVHQIVSEVTSGLSPAVAQKCPHFRA
jgi:hypothetical protein